MSGQDCVRAASCAGAHAAAVIRDTVPLHEGHGNVTRPVRVTSEKCAKVPSWEIYGPSAELQRPSRRWVEKRFLDIRYWNEPEQGGHFAAFERPKLFVAEVRAFFRLVR